MTGLQLLLAGSWLLLAGSGLLLAGSEYIWLLLTGFKLLLAASELLVAGSELAQSYFKLFVQHSIFVSIGNSTFRNSYFVFLNL